MAETTGQEKTEAPTARRLREAREEGNVARSTDLTAALMLLASIVPLAYALYHNYIALAWPKGSDSFQLACGESIYAVTLLLPVDDLRWVELPHGDAAGSMVELRDAVLEDWLG